MSADDQAVGEPERLHPLFLLTGIGGALRGMAGGYAVIAYLAVSGRLGTALIGAAALFAFLAAGLVLYWRRFEYRVGDTEIRIDSGIFSRTHRSIPFDRVQDVDISQGPVARLLGLAKVKFETGASAGQDEGVLQAITLDRAEALRELVRTRRSGQSVATPDAQETERPSLYAMDLQRLLLAGLFNFSLAVFAVLFGLTQTMGDVIGFEPFSRSFWVSLLSASDPIAQFVLANQAVAALAGFVSLVLIGIATGIVRTFLRDYQFRLDRTETGLRRRRGLMTLTDVTLPVRRAQAAIVGTGPVRDRFGWRELKLQSLARDEGGGGDHVLAPLASDEETGTILAALGWRPLASRVDWNRVSRAYVWILTLAVIPLLLLALVQMLVFPVVGALLLVVLVGGVGVRWLAWHRTGYLLDSDRLLIRTGWWRRRTLVLPIRRIQSVDLTQNFISRWFGTASLAFGVAGGGGFSAHEIPALREEKARALREQLISKLV
ncbi:MAG: PH domain-containing protein [Sphingomicrobium sp.]